MGENMNHEMNTGVISGLSAKVNELGLTRVLGLGLRVWCLGLCYSLPGITSIPTERGGVCT